MIVHSFGLSATTWSFAADGELNGVVMEDDCPDGAGDSNVVTYGEPCGTVGTATELCSEGGAGGGGAGGAAG